METKSFPDLDYNIKLTIIKVEECNEPPVVCELKEQLKELAQKKPSFRLLTHGLYRRQKFTRERKDGYYHHNFVSSTGNVPEVEYDLDDEDLDWLKSFNERHSHLGYQLSEDNFERILDKIEKESKFEIISPENAYPLLNVEEALCSVCGSAEAVTFNTILLCDMCDIPVHQECYGVPYLPEDTWLCRRCLHSPSMNVRCELCPNMGGAFKQTPDHKWVHVVCALWIPEVTFANAVFMEPVVGLEQIPAERWNLTCYICKKKGACIQCHKKNCRVPFHVTCGQQAKIGMTMNMGNRYAGHGEAVSTSIDEAKIAYCDQHMFNELDTSALKGLNSSKNNNHLMDTSCSIPQQLQQPRQQVNNKRRISDHAKRLREARKVLADRRISAPNPIAQPKINQEKLIQISDLLNVPAISKSKDFELPRNEMIREIENYWSLKRRSRAGVPLIRRLQVSFDNSLARYASTAWLREEKENYTKLRIELERARMLVGQVGKRERLKAMVIKVDWKICELKFAEVDQAKPASADLKLAAMENSAL